MASITVVGCEGIDLFIKIPFHFVCPAGFYESKGQPDRIRLIRRAQRDIAVVLIIAAITVIEGLTFVGIGDQIEVNDGISIIKLPRHVSRLKIDSVAGRFNPCKAFFINVNLFR